MSISDGYELRYLWRRRFECVGLIHVKPKSVKPRILLPRLSEHKPERAERGTNVEVDRERLHHRSSAAGYGELRICAWR